MAQCVDPLDFQLDAQGRLQLNTIYQQSAAVTFTHLLDGVNLVWEDVTLMPDMPIAVSGLYEVTMDARGVVILNAEIFASVAQCFASIHKNGVLVPNTETMLTMLSRGDPGGDLEPALQTQGTGSCTIILPLVAGDVLQIWGARSSDPGTTTQIQSNATTGRCRLTARRIGAN